MATAKIQLKISAVFSRIGPKLDVSAYAYQLCVKGLLNETEQKRITEQPCHLTRLKELLTLLRQKATEENYKCMVDKLQHVGFSAADLEIKEQAESPEAIVNLVVPGETEIKKKALKSYVLWKLGKGRDQCSADLGKLLEEAGSNPSAEAYDVVRETFEQAHSTYDLKLLEMETTITHDMEELKEDIPWVIQNLVETSPGRPPSGRECLRCLCFILKEVDVNMFHWNMRLTKPSILAVAIFLLKVCENVKGGGGPAVIEAAVRNFMKYHARWLAEKGVWVSRHVSEKGGWVSLHVSEKGGWAAVTSKELHAQLRLVIEKECGRRGVIIIESTSVAVRDEFRDQLRRLGSLVVKEQYLMSRFSKAEVKDLVCISRFLIFLHMPGNRSEGSLFFGSHAVDIKTKVSMELTHTTENGSEEKIMEIIRKRMEALYTDGGPQGLFDIITSDGDIALDEIKDSNGLNLLHSEVAGDRAIDMTLLFYMNLWGNLRPQYSTGGEYVGLTPRGLAIKLMETQYNHQAIGEFEYFETMYNNMSVLSKASLAGERANVARLLLEDAGSVVSRDNSGGTPLFYASAGGHVDLMELLMQRGADASVVNARRETCLHVAARLGRTQAVDFLLRLDSSDPSALDCFDMRATDYCIMNGDFSTLHVFSICGEQHLDARLVSVAAKYRRLAMLYHLVEDCRLGVEGLDGKLRSPIHNAVINCDLDMVRFLLDRGANLKCRDKMGRNLLHQLAARYDDKRRPAVRDIIDLLDNKGFLTEMVRQHDTFSGKELIKLFRGRDNNRRAWHYVQVKRRLVRKCWRALASGPIDAVQFGAVLHSGFGLAPEREVMDAIKKLINERLTRVADNQDCTPLHLAVTRQCVCLVNRFLRHGADVNAQDKFGLTPLHMAAMTGNIEIARLLLAKGAALLGDENNMTPVDVAIENDEECLKHLLNPTMQADDHNFSFVLRMDDHAT